MNKKVVFRILMTVTLATILAFSFEVNFGTVESVRVESEDFPAQSMSRVDQWPMSDNAFQVAELKYFWDDVESGAGGWTSDGLWHITQHRNSSPTHSWYYGQETIWNYNTSTPNSGSLTSQLIDLPSTLPGGTALTLSFMYWYETESTGTIWDQRKVLISVDGGTYNLLKQQSGDPMNTWLPEVIDLTSYAGHSVRIRFYFDTIDEEGNWFEGWYIDDIAIFETLWQGCYLWDDVESGPARWTSDGLWHITQHRSTSPTHSWYYGQETVWNYETGTPNSGSLTSQLIDLPSTLPGGTALTLSFMYWYETESTGTAYDQRKVLISVDGGPYNLLKQQSGDPMYTWLFEEIDLTSYAGHSVRIRFYFDTIDATANYYEGWYIDDITIWETSPPLPPPPLSDDVESGAGGWTSDGLWHITQHRSTSPTHSWYYGQETAWDYDTGTPNSGSLTSQLIDLPSTLPNVTALTLSFMYWYETESTGTTWDQRKVLISVDGGPYTLLKQQSGDPMYTWLFEEIDLTSYAGHSVRIRFYFDTLDEVENDYEGWYIDDIAIFCILLPPPIGPPQDLELHPREVVDLADPTGTQWHELYPMSRHYNLTNWKPGVVLSPDDIVAMNGDPAIVDEVTIGIKVFDESEQIHRWLYYECGYWTFKKDVWNNPVGSKWIEIRDPWGPVLPQPCWKINWWFDDGDGKFDSWDHIKMASMHPYPEPLRICEVTEITVWLKLTFAPFAPVQHYVEFGGTLDTFESMDYIHVPENTWWIEVLPAPELYELTLWYDYPGLSPSDHIRLTSTEPNRFIVMIGDAPAHAAPNGPTVLPGYPTHGYGGDPGRDEIMFTGDDLDYVTVIDQIAAQGITVFTVDYYGSGDAYTNFDYIASQTGGTHYYGTTDWDTMIADEIFLRTGGNPGSVVFTLDLSGSLGQYYPDIENKTNTIIDILSALGYTFGVGSHVDYPDSYDSYGYADQYGESAEGDYAWSMDTDITNSATAKSVIESVLLNVYSGADEPQNYVRVLYECQYFSWEEACPSACYHVDKLTVAMNLTDTYYMQHIVKYEGSLMQFKNYYWHNPNFSQWHEVWPYAFGQWYLIHWDDLDFDTMLSPGDEIQMVDKETGYLMYFTVESLSTDIWVTQIPSDVAVVDLKPVYPVTAPGMRTVVFQGYSVDVNVTVENQGPMGESFFNVTLTANSTVIGTQTITNLAAGEKTNVIFTWSPTTGTPKGNYTLVATVDTVSSEVDTADNTYVYEAGLYVSYIGDLTGGTANPWDFVPDGVVDGTDLIVVNRCFGSWPEAPPPLIWHPNCDINNDNVIDGSDSIVVSRHYGEIDP